jgi:hypothetical protein
MQTLNGGEIMSNSIWPKCPKCGKDLVPISEEGEILACWTCVDDKCGHRID